MLTDDITIRPARDSDLDKLSDLAIRSKAAWGYDQAFMEACRDELTVKGQAIERDSVYVAEDPDGRVLGFYHLRVEDNVGEVDALFVDPAVMRGGVGRALWRHMERELGAQDITALEVESDPNAVGFYRAMGMTVTGEVPSASIPGRSLPLLTKTLSDGA